MNRHKSKMYDVLGDTENIIFVSCVVIYITLTAKIMFEQTYSWLMISALTSAIFIGGHIGYQRYLMVCKMDSVCSEIQPIIEDRIRELKCILDKYAEENQIE